MYTIINYPFFRQIYSQLLPLNSDILEVYDLIFQLSQVIFADFVVVDFGLISAVDYNKSIITVFKAVLYALQGVLESLICTVLY